MRNAHPSHHRGAALMAVLWLIAILAVASITALKVISFDMSVAASTIHGARAKHMAEMGIAIGSHPLIERTDPLLYFEDEQKQEGYQVTLSSEGQPFAGRARRNFQGLYAQRFLTRPDDFLDTGPLLYLQIAQIEDLAAQ